MHLEEVQNLFTDGYNVRKSVEMSREKRRAIRAAAMKKSTGGEAAPV